MVKALIVIGVVALVVIGYILMFQSLKQKLDEYKKRETKSNRR
jgi:hypothetical protein